MTRTGTWTCSWRTPRAGMCCCTIGEMQPLSRSPRDPAPRIPLRCGCLGGLRPGRVARFVPWPAVVVCLGRTRGRYLIYHNNGDGTLTRVLSGSPANEMGEFRPHIGWTTTEMGFLICSLVSTARCLHRESPLPEQRRCQPLAHGQMRRHVFTPFRHRGQSARQSDHPGQGNVATPAHQCWRHHGGRPEL